MVFFETQQSQNSIMAFFRNVKGLVLYFKLCGAYARNFHVCFMEKKSELRLNRAVHRQPSLRSLSIGRQKNGDLL